MKVFVSWSGELSKKVAEELRKWIPCFIQSAEIFYSPEDIEKGERWNPKILEELEGTNYGIVCLTKENSSAPWINFEAGALAKKIEDSRVSTLLIDLQPSAIKGPLATFQATKLQDKDDFLKLLKGINNNLEQAVDEKILMTAFEAMWEKFSDSIKEIIDNSKSEDENSENVTETHNSQILEELLQLARQQTMMLSSPDILLPKSYLNTINSGNLDKRYVEELIAQIVDEVFDMATATQRYEAGKEIIREIMMFAREHGLSKKVYSMCRISLDKMEMLGRSIKKPHMILEPSESLENPIRFLTDENIE